jgi:hypothetical protein
MQMPAFANVLVCLASHLRDNGAQVAPRVLGALSAVTDFLAAMGTAPDSDVAAAAYLAAYLEPDDAKRAASDLGIWPDLIPALSKDPVDLGFVLGRSMPLQALVTAAVIFSRHAAAVVAGDSSLAANLQQAAANAILEGSRNPELAQVLVAKMAQVSVAPRPASRSTDFLFSISIDLVGSTDAKKRIMMLAGDNQTRIDEFNAKFFVVKGIGDEIWMLCDAAAADVPQVGHRLIDAALHVAVQRVWLLATEHEEGPTFDHRFDPGRVEPIRSPIKMFIDLLSHASDLGHLRDEELLPAVPDLLRTYHHREPTPLEIVTVARRMSFSRYDSIGWGNFRESRTDYIGHEIDRFFRTTKSAVPGIVTIGQAMAREMGLVLKPPKTGIKPNKEAIQAVLSNAGAPLVGGEPSDPVHARIRTLKQGELKGIGYDYDTYSLFVPRALNGLYATMEGDEHDGSPGSPYHDTAELISPNVVHDLAEEIAKSRATATAATG